MSDNKDLREQAVRAIANYMHHELFSITGSKAGEMLPWITSQGNEVMNMLDRAIANTKAEGKRRGIVS